MKQIFTQSACLFWALLLAAVFSNGTAVGQTEIARVDFSPTSQTPFTFVGRSVNTDLLETKSDNGNETAYILALPDNSSKYDGIIKLVNPIEFEKGYTYSVTLRAKSGSTTANNRNPSSATITFFSSSTDYTGFPASAYEHSFITTPLVTPAYANYTLTFNVDALSSNRQSLFVGFRMHNPSANKSYMHVDDIVITKIACPTNITVPTVSISTAPPACGAGQVVLSASGANASAKETYRWYASQADYNNGIHIPGQTASTLTIPSLSSSATYYATIATAAGCESSAQQVTVNINERVEPTADITSAPAEPVAGEPVTFTAVSTYEAKGDVLSYAWEIDRGTGWESIGNKTNQLSLESTPSKEFNVRCTITANSTGCYTVYTLTPTTEPITPLPVEIIYFTAAKQGNNVLLEWATASEENNTGFEVEVSQDGFNFRKLDFVPTKNGNTVIKQVYTFKDTENGKYGTRYYRLKQIDMDGQFEYFTTKAVSFGEVSNYSLKAFPNPFEGEVNLELNADESGKLNVQVLDAMGRSVMTQQFEVSKGRSLEKITLWQSLPKGIYFVRTEMNGQANNFKLLKK